MQSKVNDLKQSLVLMSSSKEPSQELKNELNQVALIMSKNPFEWTQADKAFMEDFKGKYDRHNK